MALLSWVLSGVLALAASSAGWELGKTWQRTGKWSRDLVKATVALSAVALTFGALAVWHEPASRQTVTTDASYAEWLQTVKGYWDRNGSGTITEIGFAGQAPTSLWVEVTGYKAAQAQELARLIAVSFERQFPGEQTTVHIYSPYPNEIAKAWTR